MNGFEAGLRKVIPATLIYVRSSDDRVLMLHRLGGSGGGKPGDYHSGKWNGLGGKLELDESCWAAARRELREESSLDLSEESFRLLGTLQFPNFKAQKNEDWMVFVFVARIARPAAEIALGSCEEGALAWVPATDLLSLNLWPGDRHFIPFVVGEQPFAGTIWYRGQDVEKWEVRAG